MSPPTTSVSSSSIAGPSGQNPHPMLENNEEKNSVVIKVGMVGDSQIGKTSLMVKYVEGSFDEDYIQTLGEDPSFFVLRFVILMSWAAGVNFMEKTISVRRTTITFSIWDLGGQREFVNMLPLVCNDAVAILFMFDLSRKSTLNSVKEWYRQARGFNKVYSYFVRYCSMALLIPFIRLLYHFSLARNLIRSRRSQETSRRRLPSRYVFTSSR